MMDFLMYVDFTQFSLCVKFVDFALKFRNPDQKKVFAWKIFLDFVFFFQPKIFQKIF